MPPARDLHRGRFDHEVAFEELVRKTWVEANVRGVSRVAIKEVLRAFFQVVKAEAWETGVAILPNFATFRRQRRAPHRHPKGGTIPEHDRISVKASRSWRMKP